MKEELMKKWAMAVTRVMKLHEIGEPFAFSRFGNDPSKSLTIPANMRKAKMILRKARQNTRLAKACIKKSIAMKATNQ